MTRDEAAEKVRIVMDRIRHAYRDDFRAQWANFFPEILELFGLVRFDRFDEAPPAVTPKKPRKKRKAALVRGRPQPPEWRKP